MKKPLLLLAIVGLIVGLSVPAYSAAPGTNSSYQFIIGPVKDDLDPVNPLNEVISFDTAPPAVVAVQRDLKPDTQFEDLDNQVEVKYYFVGTRECGAGDPRFQMQIDADGNGKFEPAGPDGNVFGALGDKPFGGLCTKNAWTYEDMTNAIPKWNGAQVGAPCNQTCDWNSLEAYLQSAFPNHEVPMGTFIDDSNTFFGPNQGCAYFDELSIGSGSLTEHSDTAGKDSRANDC